MNKTLDAVVGSWHTHMTIYAALPFEFRPVFPVYPKRTKEISPPKYKNQQRAPSPAFATDNIFYHTPAKPRAMHPYSPTPLHPQDHNRSSLSSTRGMLMFRDVL